MARIFIQVSKQLVSMTKDLVVRKTVELSAPANRVWDALTNPDITQKYFFSSRAHSDWRIGGNIEFRQHVAREEKTVLKGKIINLKHGKVLQYSAWAPASGLEDDPCNYTVITFRLSEEDGYTQLVATEENFEMREEHYASSNHAWDHVMLSLKELFEEEVHLT